MKYFLAIALNLFSAGICQSSDNPIAHEPVTLAKAFALPRATNTTNINEPEEYLTKDQRRKRMSESNFKVITCDEHESACLHEPSPPITSDNWDLAMSTAEKLLYVRNNVLKGGAGLAAPQIGVNLPVFIYTPDRKPENLKVVINPHFDPIGMDKFESYEACFSVPLRCTKIKRWVKIQVTYQDINGNSISETLDGFAAKVFQHEMDHVRGFLTVDHESAAVISFDDQQAFLEFMNNVVKEDEKRYTK
jgi:peptide deformylase